MTTEIRTDRESMQYDVVIVGAGPSGLSCAIRLKQLSAEKGQDLSVCIIEKGSEVGAHLLSGAAFETRSLDELIPDWKDKGAPVTCKAKEDKFYLLGKKKSFRLPTPPQMKNEGIRMTDSILYMYRLYYEYEFDGIHLIDEVFNPDAEHYYCAADLVVLPYKKIYQSGVLVMTLSYGKPALVSDLPPLKEVVTDMQTAFLFESENSISLAEKLNLILLDSEKLEQVRINGEELINTKYDWNEIGRQTKQAYQSLY